jgi:hypothetical protein
MKNVEQTGGGIASGAQSGYRALIAPYRGKSRLIAVNRAISR